jgi:hypothetical protein
MNGQHVIKDVRVVHHSYKSEREWRSGPKEFHSGPPVAQLLIACDSSPFPDFGYVQKGAARLIIKINFLDIQSQYFSLHSLFIWAKMYKLSFLAHK